MELLLQTLLIVIVASTPILELRGSVPLGLAVLDMPLEIVVAASILGNLLPVIYVYALGAVWSRYIHANENWVTHLSHRIRERSERKFTEKYTKYGMWALPLFVAIPLPMTGAVTGAIGAYLFKIPFKYALPLIGGGVVVAAVIVTLATTGVIAAV